MAQYPASGILFKNDRKQNERQPDYTGNIEMDKELVIDLWNQLQEGVEHRSGSHRTFYSGHTPGATCWHIEECLRELTPHTQPHPRFVIIFIS